MSLILIFVPPCQHGRKLIVNRHRIHLHRPLALHHVELLPRGLALDPGWRGGGAGGAGSPHLRGRPDHWPLPLVARSSSRHRWSRPRLGSCLHHPGPRPAPDLHLDLHRAGPRRADLADGLRTGTIAGGWFWSPHGQRGRGLLVGRQVGEVLVGRLLPDPRSRRGPRSWRRPWSRWRPWARRSVWSRRGPSSFRLTERLGARASRNGNREPWRALAFRSRRRIITVNIVIIRIIVHVVIIIIGHGGLSPT